MSCVRARWACNLSWVLICLGLSLVGCALTNRPRQTPQLMATPTGLAIASSTVTPAPAESEATPNPAQTSGPATAPPSPQTQPTQTPTRQPILPPTQTPLAEEQRLIYARDGHIFQGDYLGGQPSEVVSLPPWEYWSFHQGLLALARGPNVEVIDLQRGSYSAFRVYTEAVDYAEVHWGTGGKTLLHAALLPDPAAKTYGRNAELRVLTPDDGLEHGRVLIGDVSGMDLLRYDEEKGRASWIVRDAEGAFAQIAHYDLHTGQIVDTTPIQGAGETSLSPDGRYLLTERPADRGTQWLIYDLAAQETVPPRAWKLPQNTHTISPVWSPDGHHLAFILREDNLNAQEASREPGVWVLEMATLQAQKVLDDRAASSTLAGWTPDGQYIVGYHRSDAQDSYVFAVRPDGGDRHILNLGAEALVLGWMPTPKQAALPRIALDPWRARFLGTAGDPAAMAGVVAQFVDAQGAEEDEALSRRVREYLEWAGWSLDPAGPSIRRVAEGLFAAQLPPLSVYVLDSGTAYPVATGQWIVDVRLEGDDLGLIYAMLGADSRQPATVLLRRQRAEADGWQVLWTPEGQRDWIATDGEIRFQGQGLGALQVMGSSFGLDTGEEAPFGECLACVHRRLSATWRRNGDGYVRQTMLPDGAPLAAVYWEMTLRTPYAVVYECLRRMRQGLPAEELIADQHVLAQIQELGLLVRAQRLVPEEETAGGLRFGRADGSVHLLATVQQGRILRVERQE